MTKHFARKFALNQLSDPKPKWWQELLLRLKPAGEELSSNGLRLAVRENYLNFYHKGQAIAKVAFNRDKTLYSEQHVKYVFEGVNTQRYVRLTGSDPSLINPEKPENSAQYLGGKTLDLWIERSNDHNGDEKTFVENVAAANSNVIDMEMGLPGSGYRIDLVTLERHEGKAHLVFWEAKLTTDKRCRTNSEKPEVLEQLARYRAFLTDTDRQQQLKVAYVNACKVLAEITELADESVDPIIKEVAEGDLPLTIDCEPRLLIYYNEKEDKQKSWSRHEKKLIENKVRMQVMTDSTDYKLQSWKPC